jgi:hypothetical protein
MLPRLPFARTYLLFFGLHFALILCVSCADIFDLVSNTPTILPGRARSYAELAKEFFTAGIGRHSEVRNPLRPEIRAYLNYAGIETGYSYFAPNVPPSYKLLFELQLPDGTIEHDVLGEESAETNIRLASLLDEIGNTESDAWREILVKLATYSIWTYHPEATSVRSILGALRLPTLNEFRAGERKSYEFRYAYDFSFAEASP